MIAKQVFVFLVLGIASVSYGDVINFDTLASMPNSGNALVPTGAQLSDHFLPTHGIAFRSTSSFVAVVNLGIGHATSGANGIGGVNGVGRLGYDNPIFARFSLPTNTATKAVTDFVSVRGDRAGVNGIVTLEAYDVNGAFIARDTKIDVNGPTLFLSVAGIHSVKFFSATSNVAFDDFNIGALTAAVPEPSGFVAVLSLMIGALVRRQSRQWDGSSNSKT